jgi:hypothetical protein
VKTITGIWLGIVMLFSTGLQAQLRVTPKVGTLSTWITQVVPLVILGDGWNQKIILQNVDTSRSAVGTIRFFTQDGAPRQIALKDRGPATDTYLFNLSVGQTVIFETLVDNASLRLGWALIEQSSSGVATMLGQTIFRKQNIGSPDFMTSHVLGHEGFYRMVAYFDNTDGKYTGMGILTPNLFCSVSCATLAAAELRVTVRDLAGNPISQKTINQKPGVLYWMNLGVDFPETAGRVGTFTVEVIQFASANVTGFSLEFAPNGAFTAVTPFED